MNFIHRLSERLSNFRVLPTRECLFSSLAGKSTVNRPYIMQTVHKIQIRSLSFPVGTFVVISCGTFNVYNGVHISTWRQVFAVELYRLCSSDGVFLAVVE